MATPIRSGIPTTYSASNFRSRLEARWAAFFDLIGWQWVYEPLDCSGYIPDFLIQGAAPFFVEVGPCITVHDYTVKGAKGEAAAEELGHPIMTVGVDAMSPLACSSPHGFGMGLVGHSFNQWEASELVRDQDPGILVDCKECPKPRLFVDGAGRNFRPCGHVPGDRKAIATHPVEIRRLWREAGNRTQWRAA